jgi:hypothetical protein
MTNISIGQIVCLGDRCGVVCKKHNTSPVNFGVVFFDGLDAAILKLKDMSAWTVTDEVVSQDVVNELLAGNERVAAESEAVAEKVCQNVGRLIRAEEARRWRTLRDRGH